MFGPHIFLQSLSHFCRFRLQIKYPGIRSVPSTSVLQVHVQHSPTPPVVLGVMMENLATFIYALLDVNDQPSDETVLNPLIEWARFGNVSFALVQVCCVGARSPSVVP
jgi:hypothetical protein